MKLAQRGRSRFAAGFAVVLTGLTGCLEAERTAPSVRVLEASSGYQAFDHSSRMVRDADGRYEPDPYGFHQAANYVWIFDGVGSQGTSQRTTQVVGWPHSALTLFVSDRTSTRMEFMQSGGYRVSMAGEGVIDVWSCAQPFSTADRRPFALSLRAALETRWVCAFHRQYADDQQTQGALETTRYCAAPLARSNGGETSDGNVAFNSGGSSKRADTPSPQRQEDGRP